ncbi:MAG: hypothetical protein OHK0012_13080 [Synechococcales cyanobacterium]
MLSYWDRNRSDWLRGITLAANNHEKDYVIDGIPVHLLGFSLWEKLRMLPWIPLYYPFMSLAVEQLSRILESQLSPFVQKADLVHNVRIGREVLSYTSLKLARKRGIPFVLTPVHHPRWTGWRYKVYEQIYREADAVIALTQAERNILIGLGVNPERVYLTGHGPILSSHADESEFRQKHRLQGPFVLFLGQHYAYKGFQQLLRASARVWQEFPEVTFAFIGPPVKDSERFFDEYRDPRIIRLGAVSLQEKTDALAACDLLCVPSSQESFGGVYTEAWMFHKPVIGCPIPAVNEVVTHGEDGLLVPQEPDAIAEAITQLIRDPGLAQRLGTAGYQKVMEKYSWPQLAAKTLAVYERVLQYG